MGSSIQRESRQQDDNSERPAIDKLLTPAEVAAMTGLSMNTLAQWRSQRRELPFVKIARNCVRYRQSDFDNWIAGRIVRVDVEPSNVTRRS
jgi:predicted DNA-binding transcriptional regulator AlpA